MTSELNYQ